MLCTIEFLLQARATKVNNTEDGTEEQAEFIEDQKRHQTGESRRLPSGDATELNLDGMSACRKGEGDAGKRIGGNGNGIVQGCRV